MVQIQVNGFRLFIIYSWWWCSLPPHVNMHRSARMCTPNVAGLRLTSSISQLSFAINVSYRWKSLPKFWFYRHFLNILIISNVGVLNIFEQNRIYKCQFCQWILSLQRMLNSLIDHQQNQSKIEAFLHSSKRTQISQYE